MMTFKRLESGAWYARWTPFEWAQWDGARPRPEDFFQPSWSYTEERADEAERAVMAAWKARAASAPPHQKKEDA